MSLWRNERGLRTNKINTADYTKNTKTENKLLDIMIALSCERDESSPEHNPSETREATMHNDEIETADKNSENIDDIFSRVKFAIF